MDPRQFAHFARLAICIGLLTAFCQLAKAQDANWFHDNDRGNRYEGLLDEPNAKREYDVLGFFAYDGLAPNGSGENLPPSWKAMLHLRYYVPEEVAKGVPHDELVFIRVKQMSGWPNYLMVAKKGSAFKQPGWNEFSWPVDAVIQEKEINPAHLGVVVRLKSDNEYTEDLAPAVFYSQESPPGSIKHYKLILRVQQYTLTDLSYEIVAGGRSRTHHYGEVPVEVGVAVSLNIDLDDLPGPVTVHINGEYENTDKRLVATYRFYHEPVCCQ